MPLQNFGRNLRIQPTAYYEPRNEHEVLGILDRHRGEQIRAIGSLHSWSEAPTGEGVVLNLKHLQQIELHHENMMSVVVGAGCQIQTLLKRLKQFERTLPSIGLITAQTIAGAISTATHGSGRHSLSHYVEAIKVARYDPATGAAMIEQIAEGDTLRAARCSLGCLGIILSVTLQCREQYGVQEHFREYFNLEDVLKAETQFPLQQFFFTPWRWTYLVQHRREVANGRSRLAWLYRIHWFLTIDLGLHLLILATLRLAGSFGIMRFLYRHVIPRTVIRNWIVTDESTAMLVMKHELFRHIEMELFVPKDHLPGAVEYLRRVLEVAGNSHAVIPTVFSDDADCLSEIRGQYGHHYPICIRRVQADDTLISMSSGGGQDWYAISLISYARPSERDGFLQVMELLAVTMSRRFGARPHWGKFCPLPGADLVALYPQFAEFHTICEVRDPQGVFRNRWISSVFASS